jgi:hypothetical protein
MSRISAALEKPAAQPLLHLGDLRRQGRLADPGKAGRAAEMQRLGQRLEILHLADRQPYHNLRLSS